MRKTRSIIALNMSHSDNMSTADILTRLKCVAGWMLLIVLADALPLLRADPGSNVNQNFKSVPTTVKTFAGDTVHLPCRHRLHTQYVRWIRDGDVLADSREDELISPERVDMNRFGDLRVKFVESSDTGEYICELMTQHGLATQVHYIEVQTKPTVISVPSGTVELNIGSVFEIVCEPRGVPYPIISWRHQGRTDHQLPLTNNTRRLLVEVRDHEMAGRIECVATNGKGEATAGVDLLVLFPPEVQVSTSIVHSKIALRAYLECEVIAQPAATVHWFHGGAPVNLDHRIARQDSDLTFNQTTWHTRSKHTLIIKRVRDTDLGMYECRAENKLGFMGGQLELTGKPMPPVFKTSPLVSSPMTHNLIWQTESLSPLIEYMLRFRQVPSGNVTPESRQHHHHHQHGPAAEWMELVIPAQEADGPVHSIGYVLRGLMPATLYEVSVTARNRYGISDDSTRRRFATGGEIEVPNYSTETVDYTPIDSLEETSTLYSASFTPSTSVSSFSSDFSTIPNSAATIGQITGVWSVFLVICWRQFIAVI